MDEFDFAKVTKAPSKLVKPFRVAESPVQFECTYHSTLRLPGRTQEGTVDVIIGKVIGLHIQAWALNDQGMIDVPKIKPLARCGYFSFTAVTEVFDMIPPAVNDSRSDMERLRGLEGATQDANLEETRIK